MSSRWFSALLALLSCVGCQSTPKPEFDAEAVARCLPPGIKLDTVALSYSAVDQFTVEQELIEVGARVEKDGKLCDSSGKEIRFYVKSGERPREEAAAVDKLSEECTVITIAQQP